MCSVITVAHAKPTFLRPTSAMAIITLLLAA